MDREPIDGFPRVTLETGVKTDEVYKEHGCDSSKEPADSAFVLSATRVCVLCMSR